MKDENYNLAWIEKWLAKTDEELVALQRETFRIRSDFRGGLISGAFNETKNPLLLTISIALGPAATCLQEPQIELATKGLFELLKQLDLPENSLGCHAIVFIGLIISSTVHPRYREPCKQLFNRMQALHRPSIQLHNGKAIDTWSPFASRDFPDGEKPEFVGELFNQLETIFTSGVSFSDETLISIFQQNGLDRRTSQLILDRGKMLGPLKMRAELFRAKTAVEKIFSEDKSGDAHKPFPISSLDLDTILRDPTERRQMATLARQIINEFRSGKTIAEISNIIVEKSALQRASTEAFVSSVCKCNANWRTQLLWEGSEMIVRNEEGEQVSIEEFKKALFDTKDSEEIFPALFLRAHRGDDSTIQKDGLLLRICGGYGRQTLEKLLANFLWNSGGVPVALLGPEELARAGKTPVPRLNVVESEWKDVVTSLMLLSDTVVVAFDTTPNLEWEVERVFRLVPPERLVIAFPDFRSLTEKRAAWNAIYGRFMELVSRHTSILRDSPMVEPCHFLVFGYNWEPIAIKSSRWLPIAPAVALSTRELLEHRRQFP